MVPCPVPATPRRASGRRVPLSAALFGGCGDDERAKDALRDSAAPARPGFGRSIPARSARNRTASRKPSPSCSIRKLYALPPRLHPMALRSLTAHLPKLRDDGVAAERDGEWALLTRG